MRRGDGRRERGGMGKEANVTEQIGGFSSEYMRVYFGFIMIIIIINIICVCKTFAVHAINFVVAANDENVRL